MPLTAARRITGIDLIVADRTRAAAFYGALGFVADGGSLRFGGFRLGLIEAVPGAPPYPQPAAANDPWLQHFAIAVNDMAAAYAMLIALGHTPISRGGPQLLPPSTGAVTAYKFRDPDGHPLELSYIPGSDWLADAAPAVFLGVDHTALAVADLVASIAFYNGLGFTETGRSRNTGPEQDHLDGLDGVAVEIVALAPPGAGPHLELLHYRSPPAAAPRDIAPDSIAATCTRLASGGPVRTVRDPDGHLIVTGPAP
jgi:catechol 2,3-dioxygenase-like lactoylglutathione lyase family enzyme